jgi:predicted TIM-barrel fold metal-dependent hydrolase
MKTLPVLFDANACFGKPSSGKAEFPSIQDRLNTMDRLGISRALVWNAESVQNHALSSNQKLLDEIRNTPKAQGRIVPALTVSNLMIYERDGIASLTRQMQTLPCRALRFTNVFGRLTLMQLEPVIRAIRKQKPFIVMGHDQASVADILEFTEAFPDISLILTNVMWSPCVIVFDLLRRRKNILIDISWVHTFQSIELLVKHFGAGRLVFGTGLKSHNGAAIGALARANITEAQRKQIAHGSLDRLTGLKSDNLALPAPWKANTLWPRFLEGKPLGVDVVDAHGHLGPSGGYVLEAQEERQQLKACLQSMDAIGIQTFILSGLQALMGSPKEGNDLIETLLRPHSDRILGYLTFNPFYAEDLTPKFDAYFRGPVFKGFKTLCSYWRVDITDPRFEPMWVYANRHHLPVLNHTWDGGFNSPAMFKDLVKRYPNISFLLGHSGGGDQGRQEAEALAQKHSNVYLEWCGSFCSTVLWEDTLKRVNPRQVVFGTDAMAHGFEWELARLLSLNIPDSILKPILGGNMRRILAQRK